MQRGPPRSTRTAPLFPAPTLYRSLPWNAGEGHSTDSSDLVGGVERSETHHPATLGCGLDDGFRFALPILRCCPTEPQVGATPPTASIRRCGTDRKSTRLNSSH